MAALKTDVLILGGGLAGLSTAYHLNRSSRLSSLIVEKGDRVGGTAGSIEHEGFIFDQSGHLLHLHTPYGRDLILSLLRGNWTLHERNSWIYSHGVFTLYPFQANVRGLPSREREECLFEFFKALHRKRAAPRGGPLSFRDWCLETFGAGISRHFMFPYNEKLWQWPLSKLTTEWQGRFVPRPNPGEVLCGALSDHQKSFGYNASFRYPLRGGIKVLSEALAARLKAGQVVTRARVLAVDIEEKVAVVEGVGEVSFKRLVNTMPLVDFLDLARRLPASVRSARGRLRYNSVYCLNLGVARRGISDKHWIYFPEDRFPFYRAGFFTNFSKFVAPPRTSSLYVEISRRSGERVDLDLLERQALEGLRRCGILRSGDRLVTKVWTPIRCAYVLYDFERAPALRAISPFLAGKGVETIGRYGA